MKPVFLLEEHHEAFLIWQLGEALTGAPVHETALIHVDAHADMDLPHLSQGLNEVLTPAQAYDITYRELDVQTFITAAIYQRRFSRVDWLRPVRRKNASATVHVWSEKGQGRRLFLGKTPPEGADSRAFSYAWLSLDHDWRPADVPVVLDIDLDFFSGGGRSVPTLVEITADEYRKFTESRRHLLRSHFGSRVQVHRTDGRYYFSFRPVDGTERDGIRERSNGAAAEMIAAFGRWLRRHRIDPLMISISRSWQSGFTAEDQWTFLEKTLLAELEVCYGLLQVRHIDELCLPGSRDTRTT